MTVLTIHAQAGDPWFDEARNALSDPDALRVYVTVGDKQTVFKPWHIEFTKSVLHDNPRGLSHVGFTPATAVVELRPV